MKLKFKKQQYQEDAAQSVVECFLGQTKGIRRDVIDRRKVIINEGSLWEEEKEEEIVAFANKKIELTEEEIRNNIRNVQRKNGLEYTDRQDIKNFSIEMETGTGKTYTYIKTMYELNKAYGWSKFIVMVPSIAIREGVLKSFQITEDHFKEIYNKKIRYFVYNSKSSSNIANINNFAEDDGIQVMIINYQAFNTKSKANKRIYEELDDLQTRKPIDVLKATNPILIIDEPQKMGKTEQMLKEFSPLFTIRYSATHKGKYKYNMIYRLDAVDAYNEKLVKKINVKGIEILHNKAESTYMYLEGVELSEKAPVARMEIEVKTGNGVKRIRKIFRLKDNLYELSGGLEQYKGYTISDIDATNENYDKVCFTNGKEIYTGQVFGDANEKYMPRIQIRETIKAHFEKEKEYYKLGIKVLSLFFIDEVAKYKLYDDNNKAHNGEYAKIFEEEYNDVFNEYYNFIDDDYKNYLDSIRNSKVHAGYFSIDKKASKGKSEENMIFIDSKVDDKEEGTSSDEDAYDLIMRDKERLLSLDEPVRFIFSHSALREGWDNPNIFQICTLKKNKSEISKRQEIGRGLRICVNKDGERMDYEVLERDFFSINNLTVIASQSYESFARELQTEIAESLSRSFETKLEAKLFINRVLVNKDGKELKLEDIFNRIFMHCYKNGYIEEDGTVTQKLKDDIQYNQLEIPAVVEGFEAEYVNLMAKLFTYSVPIKNENKTYIKKLKPNKNFYDKDFQELWKKINIKTIYEVNFDSEDLIKKAIEALDTKLTISKMKFKVTIGEQSDTISISKLKDNTAMNIVKSKTHIYDDKVLVNTKYDLIGTLAEDTSLTRKTIIKILKGIAPKTFSQYQYNPEEFIRKSASLINEEKGAAIIKGITYKKTNQKYSDKIFNINNVEGRLGKNAMEVKKHIYDYLITDSENERKFADEMEKGEVKIYAKLPNGYKIPTPLGNYNPDWAIVLDKKDIKYVYFIAETKGSMSTMQLRSIEEAKIECARKYFKAILEDENIKYDVINDYDSLIDSAEK